MRAKIAIAGFGVELYIKAISEEGWNCIQNDYMGDVMAYAEDNPWITLGPITNYRNAFLQKGSVKVVSETNETLYQQTFADNTGKEVLCLNLQRSLYTMMRVILLSVHDPYAVYSMQAI